MLGAYIREEYLLSFWFVSQAYQTNRKMEIVWMTSILLITSAYLMDEVTAVSYDEIKQIMNQRCYACVTIDFIKDPNKLVLLAQSWADIIDTEFQYVSLDCEEPNTFYCANTGTVECATVKYGGGTMKTCGTITCDALKKGLSDITKVDYKSADCQRCKGALCNGMMKMTPTVNTIVLAAASTIWLVYFL